MVKRKSYRAASAVQPTSAGTSQVAVVIPDKPPRYPRRSYKYYKESDIVRKVLKENEGADTVMYEVQFEDYHNETVPFDRLLGLENGEKALQTFQEHPDTESLDEDSDIDMKLRITNRRKSPEEDFSDGEGFDTDDGSSDLDPVVQKRKGRPVSTEHYRGSRAGRRKKRRAVDSDDDSEFNSRRRSRRTTASRNTRSSTVASGPARRSTRASTAIAIDDFEDDEDESSSGSEMELLRSDVAPRRKRRRLGPGRQQLLRKKIPKEGTRKSDRATRHQTNMQEAGLEDAYRSDSSEDLAAPKAITSVREYFQELPRNSEFRGRHIMHCETCGNGTSAGPLIHCQGCILSYHKQCLGPRNQREHLVTKIGHHDFVLQCRRCVNTARKREQTAPDFAKCQACNEVGLSCIPFRERKTPMQEQKDRENNHGEDPIANVNPKLINNVNNVMFRCNKCTRPFHFHHLEPRSTHHMDIDRDDEEAASERYGEYCRDWLCKDCVSAKKVATLIAWRPRDLDTYPAGLGAEDMDEDDIEYLVKWDNQSYFRATWMPGPWVWGVTAPAMRKAFLKREDGPKMRTEDAIPEEFLRIDIVLDVRYTSIVDIRTEEIDKARVKEVDEALIKYKGLGYEDAVWEKVPEPEDGDRWVDFVTAYNDWVLGRYIHAPKQGPLKIRLEKLRAQPFAKLEKTKQPENLIGGELMKYQVEGLNWLYYQWYCQKNGILADEMGLGKTIQIIGYMATLVQDHNCFPFLVVVPNSTCANWRREIKQWAPSLRVVTYFGSSAARSMAYRHEMFPEGSKDLRCHVVVTSYEAAIDDSSRKFYRSVHWAGLIVDEGQRLKSDKSQLYNALNSLRAPFKVLLTGTPLQNNARELFNLLQFLDDKCDAAALEEKYAEMNKENITELHALIRPFILRRTKVQVLTFLPPMAQIIVPLTMSYLQKKLYKSILGKNPELLKALFSATNKSVKPTERANLNNLLMQLRKCLCHPFIYSREIEERTEVAAISHRNLVQASAKLQLLELLLPKLQERGHRVLIFSQFLDMLDVVEDFLDGLQMRYQRLDGTMGSLEKQKRIDEFNAPESSLFAFLLSTRAGGVGINLATADTVIILDPDFNPHQDIQALSRAHRIGQKKKVLCFQLMTRSSAEEKIVQIGRKKMALDHVVVESMGDEDIEEKDVESILKHGATELFSEESTNDIKFDDASVDKLLDRSQMEETKAGAENSAESQFSFARVWANDKGALAEDIDVPDDEPEQMPDPSLWENILKERDRIAAAEAAAKQRDLGRGKRARNTIDYTLQDEKAEAGDNAPSPAKPKHRKKKSANDSDTDFQAEGSSEESGEEEIGANDGTEHSPKKNSEGQKKSSGKKTFSSPKSQKSPSRIGKATFSVPTITIDLSKPFGMLKGQSKPKAVNLPQSPPRSAAKHQTLGNLAKVLPTTPSARPLVDFPAGEIVRVRVPTVPNPDGMLPYPPSSQACHACTKMHPKGACPLKVAGVEYCGLCGLAHYGIQRVCPHFHSETQVREMLQALKSSGEPSNIVEAATKYLRGLKGNLVQEKKKRREKAMGLATGALAANVKGVRPTVPGQVVNSMQPGESNGHLSEEARAHSQQIQNGINGINGTNGNIDDDSVASALMGYLGR
ncbi:hypothetical protein EJ05DRAFT_439944 [Pseudovirgaria hyperparasitica]|uniref:Chromatin remodeling complex subunit n=1 Tax=Pseudovirgaria hyperparasitica TaxID=470096 RepID=A0A6A6W4X5_9PEZI|nr:uncharacterized protein EJ05DRAFT_439944 [Pseudovirgaria hyperparasitica]KAF2757643.1 hypothetical protein EJ05DRAFT_439944 [Pseudovirgaria hyperparasitica]